MPADTHFDNGLQYSNYMQLHKVYSMRALVAEICKGIKSHTSPCMCVYIYNSDILLIKHPVYL